MNRDETAEGQRPAPVKDKLAREEIYLAGQAAEGGLKVVPGKSWAFHYPKGPEARAAAVSDLLSGRAKPEDVAGILKPDAFTYALSDLEQPGGLTAVSGKVRDVSSYVTHYDHRRFAEFVSSLQGTGVTPETAQALYDGLAQSRVRSKMLQAYGYTGRKQIEEALRVEAETTLTQIGELPREQKVLAALKMNWMAEDQLARTEQRDKAVEQLLPGERELYDQLRGPYQDYVRKGDQTAYESLVNGVREIVTVQTEPRDSGIDKSLEKLREELEPFTKDVVPPGAQGDPAIPPDDKDEYHTSSEKSPEGTYFEITPSGTSTAPLTGYYASGRKSYYDMDTKTWSKKKQLSLYGASISGTERQTISGQTDGGLKSIPIPNGYGLDASSIKFSGARPEIFRDQNGCFYLQAQGKGSFSVDFLKETTPFVGPPIADDIVPIHRGDLSPDSEIAMHSLTGGTLERAEQLRQYLFSKHFYPGDGDLQMAQALQHKLQIESTGDNYIQNLDKSEYLECYSANTLYIAMLRKAGIIARLVNGDHVQGAKDGKARIDSETGHAWSEVWDGTNWRRMDATPRPRQQKQEQDQKIDPQAKTKPAEDGGVEAPKEPGEQQQQDADQTQPNKAEQPGKGKPQPGKGQPGQGMPGQQMGEVSDQEIKQGESQLNNAQQFSKDQDQKKQTMDQKLNDAKTFNDLKKLQQEAEKSELFDDMKDDVKKRLEAKEDQMKDVVKESLDEMVKDGFMDEKRRDEIEQQLEKGQLETLDELNKQLERESTLFNEYQGIKEEVMPYVDQWFDYFVERLPKTDAVEIDEDSLTRQGAFNRRAVMKPINLLFGTVKNPRIFKPSIQPKFLASIMVDVSGSMEGPKLEMARKQLVFYNELLSRINSEFGYIRYANNIFSNGIVSLKSFDQDYESPQRHNWGDGTQATIKARLMQTLRAQGGTNMLPAIKKAAEELNRETFEYPDYASALYFIGDGEDTSGNSEIVRKFLQMTDQEGFGPHMLSAIMLGGESERKKLAAIFGDEHTTVAPDFETLIEQSMYRFDEDITAYLADKTG